MKKIIRNTWLLICSGVILVSIPLLLSHKQPIEVSVPRLTQEELAEKKKEADQAAKAAQRKNRINRVFACTTDEDCIIVDKDPCGCTIGPKGVTAINVNYITDFDALNNTSFGTKTCPDTASNEKECSPSAHAVCKKRTCKIAY